VDSSERRLDTLSAAHERELRARYGALLTLEDVGQVLRYPSSYAVRKARVRGSLPLPMVRIPQRRNWFVTARRVAEFLARLDLEADTAGGAMT
jgi:hypothetical protein